MNHNINTTQELDFGVTIISQKVASNVKGTGASENKLVNRGWIYFRKESN
jgi:hypothetical protein